ncbi:response regulator with CheY-like receiver, AAA-type ATPase, and DNA-binding domains [Burkholderia sp. Ch1-1]|uniref:Response regulator with CheY-like receiver, AAA-type ATPase, and DNA-binding domains n=1 Tax=Paraburkholderia dioscoreae TaxID=2604047 RepID=A0A5Q4ZMV1_9BURK|nr:MULTISPECIES: response regulator [Paraburkholderia]EIF34485.1 response regulator with CheY-like receiver, AAA-type ATPase, and DNA-binding domains [Burkholderia sp. Ch1-1]MDR8395349.1 response regulator [Paraburkholderia sp. USG1]VVD33427.1 Response regulator with CheY-like receiver, AAA-type ATPase, and DNA-binding domains [Paraburkholderia dioscoreae]
MSNTIANQTPLPAILFVDDEATAAKYFERAIGAIAPVVTGASVEEGKAMLDAHAASLAVLVSDQRMPGEYGNELLRYARERYPHIVRILTTAYSELDQTVEAVNQGQIHRYIKKPWDISALRMEMKQALELAGLRKERDQLVREKLGVLQTQTVATRIGTVHTLCASLIGPGRFQPVETYLAGTELAGARNVEPDWQRMDYADLVHAESECSGSFGHAVGTRLAELRAQNAGRSAADAVQVLTEVLGAAVRGDGDALIWTSPATLSEFLARPVGQAVSAEHAGWLAGLLWLEEAGGALQFVREGDTIVCRAGTRAASFAADRLAVWIERFSEPAFEQAK